MTIVTELKKLAKKMTGDDADGQRITEVLRNFHKDLTGKDSKGSTIDEIIGDLAENYEAPSGETPFKLVSSITTFIEVTDGTFELDYTGEAPTGNLQVIMSLIVGGTPAENLFTEAVQYTVTFDETTKKARFTLQGQSSLGVFNTNGQAVNITLLNGSEDIISTSANVLSGGIPVIYQSKINPKTKTISVTDVTTNTDIDISGDILPQGVTPPASLTGYAETVNIFCSDNTVVPTVDLTTNIMTIPANSLTAGNEYRIYLTVHSETKLYKITA